MTASAPDPTHSIDVCICTYRRDAVALAIDSVARQVIPARMSVRIVIADNAPGRDAERLVAAAARQTALAVAYVHAPANNISIARNACLDAASGDWIAFLDDDEVASPKWLATLLAEAVRGRWTAVLGPVDAIYPTTAPPWLVSGDVHSTRPVSKHGEIHGGYTGNVLIRRSFLRETGLRFRIEFGQTGGEDLHFFHALREAGGSIGYAPGALVTEDVPPSRLSLPWVLKRSFRSGQSHGAYLRERSRWPGRLAHLALAAGKALTYALGAVASILGAGARNRLLTSAALHCGVAARLGGLRELRMY